MKTLYGAVLSRLGLSTAEAAALHGCTIETVRSRQQGRRAVPAKAWEQLRGRAMLIGVAAGRLARSDGPVPIPHDEIGMMAAADLVLSGAYWPVDETIRPLKAAPVKSSAKTGGTD